MWTTCYLCNGTGSIDEKYCIVCRCYNIHYNGVLIFYGHIWCDDDYINPITPPSSP